MVDKISRLLEKLSSPYRVVYVGATSFPEDARDVFRRWRGGEPLLNGPHVQEFEEALKDYYEINDVITFGAGRMALYAILKAMNLRENDEVILPGYTCVVTCNAIRHAGLKPVYVDVSLQNYNLIPELVERAITPRTTAICAQHTFGIPCDMNALLDISKRKGIPVIEDGAHAIGARWNGELIGRFGHSAFFSTQATKMISTERGGFAITHDKDLARRIRDIQDAAVFPSESEERACMLRWCYRAAFAGRPEKYFQTGVCERLVRTLRIPPTYNILNYDRKDYQDATAGRRLRKYPSRMTNLMAYAGLIQLKRLEDDVVHRRIMADYLMKELGRLGVGVPSWPEEIALPSWVRFPFVVKDRSEWTEALCQGKLTLGQWLQDPIHPKGSDHEAAGYKAGMCPNAEFLSEHILNVPVDTRVTRDIADEWLEMVRKHIFNSK